MKKIWDEMTTEVHSVNEANGWWDEPVPFFTAMALLHSEVSEALQAWRQWGLADKTPSQGWDYQWAISSDPIPKPEGAASELADVLIRLVDYADRYEIPGLGESWDHPIGNGAVMNMDFPAMLNVLHDLVSAASTGYRSTIPVDLEGNPSYRWPLCELLMAVITICQVCNFDLEVEYERKLAYNRTRPYRHGNRKV